MESLEAQVPSRLREEKRIAKGKQAELKYDTFCTYPMKSLRGTLRTAISTATGVGWISIFLPLRHYYSLVLLSVSSLLVSLDSS